MKHRNALSGRGARRQIVPQPPAASPHAATPSRAEGTSAPRGLKDKIAWVAIGDLKPFPGNPRRHPEDQIARLMRSIEQVWTNPILIDETGAILAGHARLEAAERLGRSEVPTLTIAGLSAAEKRAVVIADNRLPEQAIWDFDLLREHFKELIDLDFDVELTGFSTGEIDLVLDGKPAPAATDPANDLTGLDDGPAVSRPGDVWELGRHRLICGDALRDTSYQAVLQGELAQMVVTDLIRDCSRRNGIILDPFGGSGTTILAAERTGRIARVIELDPRYVDLAVRRWEQTTGIAPRHAELGLNLTDLAAQRATPEPSSEPRYPEVIPSGEN